MEPYHTNSLHLAAFLMAKGHPTKVTGPMNARVFEFDSPTAEDDADAFYQNAPVVARLYSSALNDLKKLIHRPVAPNSNSETRNERPTSR